MFFPLVEKYLKLEWEYLSDICFEMMNEFNVVFDINTEIIKLSDKQSIEGGKSDLILNICKEFGATQYLSGDLGVNYLDVEKFYENGIEIIYQNYKHPVYCQNSSEFIPYMSCLDFLMNESSPELII